MYLYNSATHRKEEFKTHTPGHVEMYTCGPTVYHFAHIGNLRSYIMEDVLEKYLRYAGYSVNRVMNITDVGHQPPSVDMVDVFIAIISVDRKYGGRFFTDNKGV